MLHTDESTGLFSVTHSFGQSLMPGLAHMSGSSKGKGPVSEVAIAHLLLCHVPVAQDVVQGVIAPVCL